MQHRAFKDLCHRHPYTAYVIFLHNIFIIEWHMHILLGNVCACKHCISVYAESISINDIFKRKYVYLNGYYICVQIHIWQMLSINNFNAIQINIYLLFFFCLHLETQIWTDMLCHNQMQVNWNLKSMFFVDRIQPTATLKFIWIWNLYGSISSWIYSGLEFWSDRILNCDSVHLKRFVNY